MTDWRPSAPPPSAGRSRRSTPQEPPTGGPPPAHHAQAPLPRYSDVSDHDPVVFQSVLARAQDQSRYEAPVIEEERPPRKVPWKAVAWVFGLVLVAAVAAGAVYALVLRKPVVDPNTIVQASDGAPTVTTRSPQEAVRGYLEALAKGDIDAALAFGEVGGNGSRVLLDKGFHARMRESAPIEDIQIITQEPDATNVEVSYSLGGEQVETSFPLVRDDTGNYQLERTTVTVVIELGQAEALPLLVGGVEVQKFAPLEVVPGRYELSTGLKFIEYPAENSFEIRSLQFAEETSFPATPRLTGAGIDAFRSAVEASLDRCVRAQSPTPEGCPQGVNPTKPLVPSTIRWQLVGNPLSQGEPSLSTEDLTQATLAMDMLFRVSFDYADGSKLGVQDIPKSKLATANMLGKHPSEVKVTWRG